MLPEKGTGNELNRLVCQIYSVIKRTPQMSEYHKAIIFSCLRHIEHLFIKAYVEPPKRSWWKRFVK